MILFDASSRFAVIIYPISAMQVQQSIYNILAFPIGIMPLLAISYQLLIEQLTIISITLLLDNLEIQTF